MLNIIAGTFSTGTPPAPPSSYESIETATVGSGGASSVTFSVVPSTYTHLQIRAIARIATGGQAGIIQFNGDTTTTNYYQHGIEALGSGTPAGFASNSFPTILSIPSTANIFAVTVTDILDYANTNKYKTIRVLTGQEKNTTGELYVLSGLWKNTNAITSILIKPNASSFAEYTQFALYGIKGS